MDANNISNNLGEQAEAMVKQTSNTKPKVVSDAIIEQRLLNLKKGREIQKQRKLERDAIIAKSILGANANASAKASAPPTEIKKTVVVEKPPVESDTDSEEDDTSDSEDEVIVYKPKPKTVKKTRVIYVSESDDSETEVVSRKSPVKSNEYTPRIQTPAPRVSTQRESELLKQQEIKKYKLLKF
jgi:hypothetical protein